MRAAVTGGRPFVPFTGYDPIDGCDERVTLSRDNPLRPAVEHGTGAQVAAGDSASGERA